MRAFLAIDLPPHWKHAILRGLPPAGQGGVRWGRPEQLHITLRFLGELAPARVAPLCAEIAAAARTVAPFELSLGEPGCFPSPRNARVLWLGVRDAAQGCARWVAATQAALEQAGYPPEARPFTPHITLARISDSRRAAGIVRSVLENPPALPGDAFRVERVTLFRSELHPHGARYTALESIALSAAGD